AARASCPGSAGPPARGAPRCRGRGRRARTCRTAMWRSRPGLRGFESVDETGEFAVDDRLHVEQVGDATLQRRSATQTAPSAVRRDAQFLVDDVQDAVDDE